VTPASPQPSARLLRAAQAERADLARYRARLEAKRECLRTELQRIEAGLAEVRERERLLQRLAPRPADEDEFALMTRPVSGEAPEIVAAGRSGDGADDHTLLRGPAIRETAVQLLVDDGDAEALHYREWYERVRAARYAVAGKDPLAVFLTQLSRSPALRKSTQAGVYELDRSAPARLRQRLEELHEELRGLTATTGASADLAAIRARRDELNSEIGQTEKALEEASRLLGVSERALAAAG
jgi:predicted  nucleic acid-binding Zn-ribbon protein